MTIRLILDSQALLAYVADDDLRGMGVAEVLVMVAENGQLTGIPALCMIEAYRGAKTADEQARLLGLTSDDDGMTVLLPLLSADLPVVAEWSTAVSTDRAQAAAAAVKHGALLATFDRAAYPPSTIGEDDILDL